MSFILPESLKLKKIISLSFLLIILFNCGCYRISRDELSDVESALESSNYPLAFKKLSKLGNKYKENAIVYYLTGYSFLKTGDTKDALEAFKKTFAIKKNYSVMIGDVDVANFLAGNSQESDSPMFRGALRELDTIISKHGGGDIEDRIRYHKALLLVLKKEYEKSISELQKIVKNNIDSEYDAEALFKIGTIVAENLQNENEGLKIITDLINKYTDKGKTTSRAMLWIAEYKIKKSEMFDNRAKSLEDFVKSWKGINGFQEDIKEAIVQIESDRKKKKMYLSEAMESINEIIEKYPESNSAKQAKIVLNNLNSVSEQNS